MGEFESVVRECVCRRKFNGEGLKMIVALGSLILL